MSTTTLPPTGLLCELRRQPQHSAISTPTPHFGWICNDLARDARQAGFQILVASSPERLARDEGDLWDSGAPRLAEGWVTDSRSIGIPYAGKTLQPNSRYWWKVRTWNARYEPSFYSEPQEFRTGELSAEYVAARQPLVAMRVEPVRVVQTAPDRTFVDFGRAAFATLELTLPAATAGHSVQVHLGEVPDGPHAIHRSPGGTRRYREVIVPLPRGTRTVQVAIPPDARNTNPKRTANTPPAVLMPDGLPEVLPFRYAEICGYPAPVGRDQVRQVAVHHLFDDRAARFVSSNPVLNDVWELCRYTMKATSFLGLYVDGDRERIPYEADAYINQLGHYGCDREYSMARRTIEYLFQNPTWPTEWCLFMPLLVWADYEHTGDLRLADRHYDDLKAKCLLPLARPDGLISTQNVPPEVLASVHLQCPLKDIVDWPQCERDGYELRPINTVVNAFHYRAVVLLARLAEALGKGADARDLNRHAAAVRQAMLERLVEPAQGLFVDGEGSDHISLHGNLFPLAFGVAPETMAPGIAAYLGRRGMVCSVYAAQFLLEALYRAGAGEAALALLTSTGERSWAHMIYDVGSTIALEAWDNRFKPNQDWNHAWGAAPANLIPHWLMGVRPLEPGFGRLLIQPQPGNLAYAEMTLPTIRGPVRVRLNQEPGRTFALTTDLPANTAARVLLPRLGRADAAVVVDGRPVSGVPEGDWVAVDGIGSGPHSFVRAG